MKKLILIFSLLLTCGQFYAQDYCVDGGPTSTFDSNVESVDLVGETVSVTYLGCQNSGNGLTGVEDQTNVQVADLVAGSTYTLDIQFGTCGGNFQGAGEAWIDFNQDFIFQPGESVGTLTAGTPPFALSSFSVAVPGDAINGQSRLRVMQWEGGSLPLDPCASFTWGSVVDLGITISGGVDLACQIPFNPTLDVAFDVSADFVWDAEPNAVNGYIWEVYAQEEDPATSTPVSSGTFAAGSTSGSVTGLTELSNYDFYIASDCGPDAQSDFNGPVPFSTLATCPPPSNTLVNNLTDTSLDVSWDESFNASSGYIWEVYLQGDDPAVDSPVVSGTFPTATNTGNITGLSELNDYDLYLTADCGTEGTSVVDEPLSFSTLATCPSPTNISVTNISVDAADISWAESFNASNGYDWELFAAGDEPATAMPLQSGNESFGATSLSLSGLMDNADYDFYITSDCDTDGLSLTEGPVSFTTLALPPVNDNLCDATALTVGVVPPGNTYTNLGATAQAGEPEGSCFNAGLNGSVWFTFVAPASGEVQVSTDIVGATLIDTEIAVYEAPTDCADPSTLGPDLGCNQDGGNAIGFNSILDLTGLTGGVTYYIQVDQWGTATPGDFGISVINTNPPCPSPENIVLDDVSDTTADLSWDDVSAATEAYNWFVYDTGADTVTAAPVATGNVALGLTSVNITGLVDDTIYDFYVQSDCGTSLGLSSLGAPFTFQTDCAPFATPFTEDFESYTPTVGFDVEFVREGCFEDLSPEFDYRWNIASGPTPSPVSGPSNGNSGSQYIFADSSTGFGVQTAVLSTPTFDLSGLSQPTLSFFYHMFGPEIGSLAIDIDNGTTIDSDVLILDGSQQNSSTEPWKIAYVDLSSYSGQNVKFIFKATRTDHFQGSDIALDDITLGEAPSCLPVNNISASNIGDTSVDLSWVGNSTASSYNWELYSAGDDPAVSTPLLSGNEINTNFTLSGLTASTLYDFYVTSDCGPDGESIVTGPLNFSTAGCPVSDQCDFTFILSDTFGDGWNGNTMDVLQNGVVVAILGSNFTSGSEFTEVVSLCDGSNFELYWNAGGSFQNEVGIEIIDSFDEFVFELVADPSNSNDTSLFTDVISCSPPPCPKPDNLSVSNLMPTSVTLNWGDNGNAVNGYNWYIFLEGEGPAAATPLFSGSTPDGVTSVDVTGLTEFEDYEFYVEADCGSVDGISSLDGPLPFFTPCNIFTPPYLEDFNSNADDIPFCWRQGSDNDEDWRFDEPGFSNIGNGGTLSGSTLSNGGFAWVSDGFPQSTNTRLLSPFIDISSLSMPQLSFFFISDNQGSTNVDFTLEVWDGAQWNQVFFSDQNSLNEEWEEVVILLDNLTITGNIQVAFQVDENNGFDFSDDLAIDDVEVKEAPTCPRPLTNPGITVQNITDISAEVSWVPALATQMEFDIEVVVSGNAPTGIPTYENVTNIPYLVTGLNSETMYDVYVRADCGAGDESDWIGPSTFETPITPINVVVNSAAVNYDYCYDNNEFKEFLFVSSDGTTPVEILFYAGAIEDGTGSTDRCRIFNGFDATAPVLYDTDVDGVDMAGVQLVADSGALYIRIESDIFDSCQNGVSNLVPLDFDVFAGTFSSIAFSDANFRYYPNPVRNSLNIESANPVSSIQIFDILGKQVFKMNVDDTNPSLNLEELNSGTYLMQVNIGSTYDTFKIIKE